MPDEVTLLADDDVVPGVRENAKRHLVGHRPGRKKQRCLFAEQAGDPLLEPVDRGILSVLVIPDRGGGDGRPHGGRGTGDGVGSEVDHLGLHGAGHFQPLLLIGGCTMSLNGAK